ncbi:MAG: hypothetical protein H0W88_09565 [Parachlamydiaceae bacterium]|nr:hypothetical protein [Parachlamydiaceae bacterium]
MTTPLSDIPSKESIPENVTGKTQPTKKDIPPSITDILLRTKEVEASYQTTLKNIEYYFEAEAVVSMWEGDIERLAKEVLMLEKDETENAQNKLSHVKSLLEDRHKILNKEKELLAQIIQKIGFSPSSNPLIKNALTGIKSASRIALSVSQRKHLFVQAVHVGLKGYVDPEISLIQKDYSGTFEKEHSISRAQYALELLVKSMSSLTPIRGIETEKDKEDLARICKHRTNFRNLCSQYSNLKVSDEQIRKMIQDSINALDDPNSPAVVKLENGTTSFVIPGGWTGHYISYEIRKNKDGTYEFIIHNRGDQSNDERFHGKVTFVHGNKTYARTRVPIRVSKKVLENSKFLDFIINAQRSDTHTGKQVYDKFYEHLIRGNEEILVSENEKHIKSLIELSKNESLPTEQKEKIKTLIFQLIKTDPNFHSRQLYGTCTESNATTPEKDMASKGIQRLLKLYTISGITDDIRQQFLSGAMIRTLTYRNIEDTITKFTQKIPWIFRDINKEFEEIPKKMFHYKELEDDINYLNEEIIELSKKPLSEEDKAKVLDMRKDIVARRNYQKKIQSDIISLILSVKNTYGSPTSNLSPEAYKLLEELHTHIIYQLGIDRTLNIHLGNRITELSGKLEKPPKKRESLKTENIQKFIKETLEIDNKSLLNNLEKIKDETEFTLLANSEIDRLNSRLSTIKQHYTGQLKLQALQSLFDSCFKDNENIQNLISHFENLSLEEMEARLNKQREQKLNQLKDGPSKDQQLQKFEEKAKILIEATKDFSQNTNLKEKMAVILNNVKKELDDFRQ